MSHLATYSSTAEEREIAEQYHDDTVNDSVLVETEALGASTHLISALKGNTTYALGTTPKDIRLRAYAALATQISINTLSNWWRGAVLVNGAPVDFIYAFGQPEKNRATTWNSKDNGILATTEPAWSRRETGARAFPNWNKQPSVFTHAWVQDTSGTPQYTLSYCHVWDGASYAKVNNCGLKPSPWLLKLRVDLGQGWQGSVQAAKFIKDKAVANQHTSVTSMFSGFGSGEFAQFS